MPEREKFEHPSYGMLSFHHIRGGNPVLFGSSVPHDEKIQLTIQHADCERSLNRNWYFGKKNVVELEMSYAQFAEAISNMNTSGVPCTLLYTEKDGRIPDCEFELSRKMYEDEFAEKLKEANEVTNQLIASVSELFEKPRLTKAEKEEVLRSLQKIKMEIGVNSEHILKQFNAQMEKTVSEAKADIEEFARQKKSVSFIFEKEPTDLLEQS